VEVETVAEVPAEVEAELGPVVKCEDMPRSSRVQADVDADVEAEQTRKNLTKRSEVIVS